MSILRWFNSIVIGTIVVVPILLFAVNSEAIKTENILRIEQNRMNTAYYNAEKERYRQQGKTDRYIAGIGLATVIAQPLSVATSIAIVILAIILGLAFCLVPILNLYDRFFGNRNRIMVLPSEDYGVQQVRDYKQLNK